MKILSNKSTVNSSQYKEHYSKYGWVSIVDLFDDSVVDDYYQILLKELNWDLVTMVNGKPFIVPVNELKEKPAEFINQFVGGVINYAAQNPFQYFYENIRLNDENHNSNVVLKPFFELCESQEFLTYLKEVTSDESESKIVETQITRYSAGSFLKEHTDHSPDNPYVRNSAFIIGFTKSWSADWGGNLNIFDKNYGIYRCLSPQFNSVNIFKVPRKHFVSQVSNFCPQARISISGWVANKK